jgi:hypothetical protein
MKYLTRNCSCTHRTYTGQARPEKCVHGNRFQTDAELNPPPRKPLPAKSPKRQAEEDRGARPRRRSGLKQTQRRETAAEKRARLHFKEIVKARKCWFAWHRPCERCGGKGETKLAGDMWWVCTACNGDGRHHCEGRKDAHHLVPQRFTRRMFQGVLSEADFVAILHNPLIGAPLCRKAHDLIEAKRDRIYFEDLTPECIEYVGALPDFVLIELERQCPKRPEPSNQEAATAVSVRSSE